MSSSACAIDTNILLYAHHDQYAEHKKTRSYLEKFLSERESFCLTWQVCYEYIRIVSHPRVHQVPVTSSRAWQDLEPYLSNPRCQMLIETDGHGAVLAELLASLPSAKGNFLHDCHLAVILKEHGIREILTADTDFYRFPFLKVNNPCV